MPIYQYKCPGCGEETDVEHPMAETSAPGQGTIKKTTCNKSMEKDGIECHERWKRSYAHVTWNFGPIDINRNPEIMEKRQKKAEAESKKHFKKTIDTLPPEHQSHFLKKYGYKS